MVSDGPNYRSIHQNTEQKLFLVLQKPNIYAVSVKELLSTWRAEVLTYFSARCGITFTSMEQVDVWLRTCSQTQDHLERGAVHKLFVMKLPTRNTTFPLAHHHLPVDSG